MNNLLKADLGEPNILIETTSPERKNSNEGDLF